MTSTPTPHFGSASRFIIVNVDRGETKNWTVRLNPGAKLSKKRGITAADYLIKEKVNTLIAGELGEGPFHVLSDCFVEIYKLQRDSGIKETIEEFLEGKLEKMFLPKKQ